MKILKHGQITVDFEKNPEKPEIIASNWHWDGEGKGTSKEAEFDAIREAIIVLGGVPASS